jgi:DNA-directed RNA polymerase subunit M/transcription elongation factor TFIIS
VIYFFCSECREELEAEDSIRGSRMKCPACLKEIEVPQAGVKAPTIRAAVREAPATSSDAQPGTRFILWVLLLGLVGLLVVGGVGYTLLKRERERAERARPKCGTCTATGRVACAACAGSKSRACRECSGTGKRKNFRDQEEDCFACAGKSVVDCPICGGRGGYTCTACSGSGHLDTPPRK